MLITPKDYGSKTYAVNIKIRSKAFHNFKAPHLHICILGNVLIKLCKITLLLSKIESVGILKIELTFLDLSTYL